MNLQTNDPLLIKKDIDLFHQQMKTWSVSFNAIQLEYLLCIIKKITFLKVLSNRAKVNDEEQFFFTCLIHDFIYALHSIKTKQDRYFYFNFRSSIENFLRLNFEGKIKQREPEKSKSHIGIMKLLKEYEKYDKQSYNNISPLYELSCCYVHSNPSVDIALVECFQQTEQNTHLSDITGKLDKLILLLKIIIDFIFTHNKELIETAFCGINKQIDYLVGEEKRSILSQDN